METEEVAWEPNARLFSLYVIHFKRSSISRLVQNLQANLNAVGRKKKKDVKDFKL